MAQREKEKKEENLRALAMKAREERAGIRRADGKQNCLVHTLSIAPDHRNIHKIFFLVFYKNICCGYSSDWFCWGLTAGQLLWVILCRLPEKGRKEVEEIVEEMKERDGRKRNRNDREETKEIKTFPPTSPPPTPLPPTPTCYKDSKPCPAVSQYQTPGWCKVLIGNASLRCFWWVL